MQIRNLSAIERLAVGSEEWYDELLEFTYRFRDRRHPSEVVQTRHIRATADKCEFITLGYKYHADARKDATKLTNVEGMELFDEEDAGDGFFVQVFELDEPLQQNQPTRVSLTREITTDRPAEPFYYYTPWNLTKRADLRLQFDRAYVPQSVWRFAHLPILAVPGRPSPKAQLSVSRTGLARCEFAVLERRLAYGAGWIWPEQGVE